MKFKKVLNDLFKVASLLKQSLLTSTTNVRSHSDLTPIVLFLFDFFIEFEKGLIPILKGTSL